MAVTIAWLQHFVQAGGFLAGTGAVEQSASELGVALALLRQPSPPSPCVLGARSRMFVHYMLQCCSNGPL